MTEWRKALRSWPRETAQVAEADSLPAWIDLKARTREVRGEMLVAAASSISAFGLPMGAMLLAMHILVPSGTGPLAASLAIGGLAASLLVMFAVAERGEAWLARRRARRALDRLEAKGEATLGGEVVGVTYAERRWRVDMTGDAWDWGVLRFDLDRLSFVGEQSHFELLPGEVVATEIRRFDSAPGVVRARLYLRYLRDGCEESIGLDLPYAPSKRRRVEEALDIRERVERWRREPEIPSVSRAVVATPLAKPRLSRFHRIGRPAKMLAGLAMFGLMLVFEVVLAYGLNALGLQRLGAFSGGFFIVFLWLWVLLAAKIETKSPDRWRYREPEVTPAMDLGEARTTSEDEVRARG